jgi:uncharacterized protein YabE (DUF348 family)
MEEPPIITYKDFSDKYLYRKFITPTSAAFIILLIFIIVSSAKTFTVSVGGQDRIFITYKSTVEKALESKKITIGPKDKIEPTLDSKLSRGENIVIKRAVNVKVAVDDKKLYILSSEENIASMLQTEGITLNVLDRVSPDREIKLEEGMEIDITRVEMKTSTEPVPIKFKEVMKKDSRMANTKTKIIQEGKDGEKLVTTESVYENTPDLL